MSEGAPAGMMVPSRSIPALILGSAAMAFAAVAPPSE
jgi:hypothetical protein